VLHVANGHATTGLIELAGLPGRTMVWCDPLHDGPVPGDISDDELIRMRAEHLRWPGEALDDVVADLRAWRAAIRQQDYDELVLWYEHDLFDQLNLIQLLSGIGEWQLHRPVSLVSIDSYPGHPDFKGIGELEPAGVASLFTQRARVGSNQIALASRAWQAFRAGDPRALEAFLSTDTTALLYLAAALQRHLEEFPGDRDGLSRTERTLMGHALDGPADLHRVFPRMHDSESAFFITDTGVFECAEALAHASPPLVSLRINDAATRSLPKGEFALTQAGRDVLAGAADRVALCGIDRWLGGVHLNGRGPTWRWSRERGELRFG
jgi:hypothetical protein